MSPAKEKIMKRYNSHLVYILSIDDGKQFYCGSHNGNRTYTETGILSQSGNPLQKIACKNRDWDSYYNRVELIRVEQFNSEEEALKREQEILDNMFYMLPRGMILNKRPKGNRSHKTYSYEHSDAWKANYSSVMQKPKSSTKRMIGPCKNEEVRAN